MDTADLAPANAAVTPQDPPMKVALCGHTLSSIDADAFAELQREAGRGREVVVEVVDDLCRSPRRLVEAARGRGVGRLVVGLCDARVPSDELASWGQRAHLEPFGLEIVPLTRLLQIVPAGERGPAAARLLAAAVAKLDALPSGGGSVRAVAGRLGRRSLLSGVALVDRPVATLDVSRCVGTRRCGLCIGACPERAISAIGAIPIVAAAACTACGRCVTACPARAMQLAGVSLAQFEAQLDVLTAEPGNDVVLACRDAPLPAGDAVGWLPIEVPCLEMVTPGWVLQLVARGVAVALRPCDRAGASRWRGPTGEVSYCRRVLASLGHDAPGSSVRLLVGSDGAMRSVLSEPRLRRSWDPSPFDLSEPHATADALLRLTAASGATEPATVVDDLSPLGTLEIDPRRCTLCGSCALACPTGALDFDTSGDGVQLAFDASRCLACGRCADVCPEHAAAVTSAADVRAVAAGSLPLLTGTLRRCDRCGVILGAVEQTPSTGYPSTSAGQAEAAETLCPACLLGSGSRRPVMTRE